MCASCWLSVKCWTNEFFQNRDENFFLNRKRERCRRSIFSQFRFTFYAWLSLSVAFRSLVSVWRHLLSKLFSIFVSWKKKKTDGSEYIEYGYAIHFLIPIWSFLECRNAHLLFSSLRHISIFDQKTSDTKKNRKSEIQKENEENKLLQISNTTARKCSIICDAKVFT